jgi:hypothetical protein
MWAYQNGRVILSGSGDEPPARPRQKSGENPAGYVDAEMRHDTPFCKCEIAMPHSRAEPALRFFTDGNSPAVR